MLVNIIIATRNRCAALDATLAALRHVAIPDGIQPLVIVADNGSSDATPEVLRRASLPGGDILCLTEPECGKSAALNTALRHAQGDILAFIDDDVRPAPNWLERIVAPIAENRRDAVSGTVRIAPALLRPWMRKAHLAWLAATDYIDNDHPTSAVGANMAVAHRVIDRVPRFDTELGPGKMGLWEDTLFAQQLLAEGFRLGFADEAVVEHHFDPSRLTRAAFLSHASREGRSSAYVARHWRHEPSECSRYALHYRLRLFAKRLLSRRHDIHQEGIAEWEMNLVCGIAYADQFRREQSRPLQYDKRAPAKRSSVGTMAHRRDVPACPLR